MRETTLSYVWGAKDAPIKVKMRKRGAAFPEAGPETSRSRGAYLIRYGRTKKDFLFLLGEH